MGRNRDAKASAGRGTQGRRGRLGHVDPVALRRRSGIWPSMSASGDSERPLTERSSEDSESKGDSAPTAERPATTAAPRSPSRVMRPLSVQVLLLAWWGEFVVGLRRFARDPACRTLRWALVIGAVIRLVLAPLTDWPPDTVIFALSEVGMLFSGSPYLPYPFYNPPLAPLLNYPLFDLLSRFVPPQSFVFAAPQMDPVSIATGFMPAVSPLPMVLLLWKLPMILADLGAGAALFQLLRDRGRPKAANYAVLAWLLNPLVIWVSAIHGEVDSLVALFLVLLLLALHRGWNVTAGVCMGLAILTKAWPAILLPVVLASVLGSATVAPAHPFRSRGKALLVFVAGALIGAAPMLEFGPSVLGILLQQSSSGGAISYGGFSPLLLFNHGIAGGAGLPLHLPTPIPATVLSWVLLALLGLATILSAVFLYRKGQRSREGRRFRSTEWLALACLWATVAVLLADVDPQPEELVDVLPLLLLAGPLLGPWGRRSYWLLTGCGLGLYFSQLTPLAFFYPAALVAGGGSVAFLNGVALSYWALGGPLSRYGLWVVLGLLGAFTLLLLSALCFWKLLPVAWQRKVRSYASRWARTASPPA